MSGFFGLEKGDLVHFIGIGGISMSALAQILFDRGYRVTGSDRTKSHITDKLEALGITVFSGHDRENVEAADLVVHTAAVHEDNPELMEARRRNIPVINRAQCLGELMRGYDNAVCVAGTHGKTTTTSMIAHALIHADTNPTISVGGELDIINGNFKIGSDKYFVTEACEYTNSFLEFYPTVALITNIEEDHLDFFKDINDIIESFRKFAMLTKGTGKVVAVGGDKNVEAALADSGCDVVRYGIGKGFDYTAENIVYENGCAAFDIAGNGRHTRIRLNVPGEHNIFNALAAVAVCGVLGIDEEQAARGIETFYGAHRRFEKRGTYNGALVIDDYAHHPTEIRATLSALAKYEKNRLWCVFQPHTYTRTKLLWDEFLDCFKGIDELILVDIYAARELPDGVTTSENLAAAIAGRGISARYAVSFEEAERILAEEVSENDIILTMGAGNVVDIADSLTHTTSFAIS